MAPIPAEWVRNGFIAGYRANGIIINRSNVGVTDRGVNTTFMIRIGQNKNVLPSLAYIESQIKADRVAPGSVQGAMYCLVGMVQKSGHRARVTARIIRTETAEVLVASKADAAATPDGITQATTRVVTDLSKQFL